MHNGGVRSVALAAVLGVALLAAEAAGSASTPRLSLVQRSPVVLKGTGFDAREQVVVTVRAPSLVVRRTVRAGANGRFRAVVRGLSLTGRLRCASGVTIVVKPSRGQLLLWHPPKLPDCASPPLHPA